MPTKVLICDEPTRGVDVGAKDQIYDILIGLARQGLGVILISSELKELLALSHRLLFVNRGRIDRELATDISEHELVLLLAGTADANEAENSPVDKTHKSERTTDP